MSRLTMLAACLLVGATAACAPNPIIARDPVAAPTPVDAFTCESRARPLNAFSTDCEPVPRAPILRAKG